MKCLFWRSGEPTHSSPEPNGSQTSCLYPEWVNWTSMAGDGVRLQYGGVDSHDEWEIIPPIKTQSLLKTNNAICEF